MKKLITGIVMAAFLTFAVAGQAVAYFENDHLTMFAYTPGGNEVGYDLGDTATMDFTAVHQVLAPAGTFDWLAETGATSLADINLGIYAGNRFTMDGWFVTTLADTEPDYSQSNVGNFWNAIDNLRAGYTSSFPDDRKVSGIYADHGSYGAMMNVGDTARGYYGKFNKDLEYGELILADAGALNDLYLYHIWYPGYGTDLVLDPGATTLHKAVIDIGLDGSVTMNPVPIPGAVILFGSGLLGLVGIRRRKLA